MHRLGIKRFSALISFVLIASSLSLASASHAKKPRKTSFDCSRGGVFWATSNGLIEVPKSCKGRVDIPSGVKSITQNSFKDGQEVTGVTIPKSVTRISEGAFSKTTKLVRITVKNSDHFFAGNDGVLFDKEKLTLISYPAARKGSLFEVPKSVKAIGDEAFIGAKKLAHVRFHSKSALTTIGESAFEGSSIRSITFPPKVTTIGKYAFKDATRLVSVNMNMASGLKEISDGSFSNTGTRKISIPLRVSRIGQDAFANSRSLTSVTFRTKSQLTDIGKSAFAETAISRVIIPLSVERIDDKAFYKTQKMHTLIFRSGSSLTQIGESAFSENKLTSVAIPATVISISVNAFSNNRLTSVRFSGNAPIAPSNFLGGNPNLTTVNVSSSSTGWPNEYFGIPVTRNP